MKNCLIIGAGMAGLLAGTFLQENGIEVTVFDKGRGVGGRMATRRLGEGRADHGAQFFTVRSEVFASWVDDWLTAGVVLEWTRGFDGYDGHPRYRGIDGMTAVPKHLARQLDVRLDNEVVRITQGDGTWQVETRSGTGFSAGALLLTSPVPQSLALLDAGQVVLPVAERMALEEIRYDPCFAIMAVLSGNSGIPAPGGIQLKEEPIAWIADNHLKGISGPAVVTIHAGPKFSRTHFEEAEDRVAEMLLAEAEAAGWLRRDQVEEVQVRRWKYAQPDIPYPRRYLLLNDGGALAFAGDAFGESRVEGAALSGLAAAEKLVELLE